MTAPDLLPDELAALQPVILAGGTGRRLWPLSTASRPKPYLPLLPEKRTLFQAALLRAQGMKPPLVVGNVMHRDLMLRDLRATGLKPQRLLLEGQGRGTAAALGFAAHLSGYRADPLLLVLPSDHRIDDEAAFRAALHAGIVSAQQGAVVLFGIPPRRAATRYGYIQAAAAPHNMPAPVTAFIEKPDSSRARALLRSDRVFWNSGMFLLRAATALAILPPALAAATGEAVRRGAARQESVLLDEGSLRACVPLSIDHALMQADPALLQKRAVVIPAAMGWRDLGTWPALLAHFFS